MLIFVILIVFGDNCSLKWTSLTTRKTLLWVTHCHKQRSLPSWDVVQRQLIVTDVSGQRIASKRQQQRVKMSQTYRLLKMGQIRCSEKSVTSLWNPKILIKPSVLLQVATYYRILDTCVCAVIIMFMLILTYLLTYSMEQSTSWEANWFCS